MKKPKTYTELYFEVRRSWNMNPVTRVHDSKNKKDTKRHRRDAKKSCRSYTNDSLQDFFIMIVLLAQRFYKKGTFLNLIAMPHIQ